MIDALERSEAPHVRLAGRDWAIPDLAVKQIMRLVPALARLDELAREAGGPGVVASEEQIRRIYDVAYIALTRAYPELTREAFDDLPIRIDEIVAALPVIARQAGLEPRQPIQGGAMGEE